MEVRALEERLKKQERQLRTLETQVGVLIQGMNELSLRQKSANETMEQLESRSRPPSIDAMTPPPTRDGQLLERVDALEAEVRALSRESWRCYSLEAPPAELHGHHVHGANKHAEHAPSPEPCEESRTDAKIPLGVLTSHRLDAGDMYEMNESVWDGCLFLGIAPLGKPVSALMAAMYVLNVFVQAAFVMIAWNFMVEPDVGTDTLEGLLRFRVGLAHSVEYADTVLQRSMASQICNEEDKLHMSAAQRTLYSDSLAFSSGGPLLSLLAQLCWLGSMVKEVNAAYSFTRSVLQVPRGGVTEVITADSSADGLHEIKELTKERTSGVGLPSGSLVALTVVTRVTALSRARLLWALFGITLPRVLLASSVGYVGVYFLATSAQMSDLVLNAIALAFIIEMDELIYDLFAPRRLHTLMNNIEPLPMPPLRKCIPGLNCLLKLLFVVAGVFLIQILLLEPVFWRLKQAQDILCSGEQDFVYARNPATGMVHVTRTAQPQGWSQIEKTLLQVARPELESKHGFDPGQELLALAVSNFSMAVVTQTGMSASLGGVTLEASEFEPGYFEAIMNIGSWTVGEMAVVLPCVDREAGASFDQADWFLEQVTGIPGFTCTALSTASSEIDSTFLDLSELCSNQAMVNVRALCPEACGCQLGMAGMTGLFGTVDYGCPQSCYEFQTIIDQWTYFNFKYIGYTLYYYNYYGDGDAGNSSRTKGSPRGACTDALDVELIGDPSASLACLGNFSHCLELTGRFTRWYATYVRGIIPYMYGVWGASERLEKMAAGMNSVGLLPVDSIQNFTARFWAGGIAVSLLDNTWTLADPQVPHPRGLHGCRFLASYELSALLGFDLCNPGTQTSIRGVCPVSCGCRSGMKECPSACTNVDFGESTAAAADTDNASSANANGTVGVATVSASTAATSSTTGTATSVTTTTETATSSTTSTTGTQTATAS